MLSSVRVDFPSLQRLSRYRKFFGVMKMSLNRVSLCWRFSCASTVSTPVAFIILVTEGAFKFVAGVYVLGFGTGLVLGRNCGNASGTVDFTVGVIYNVS